MKKTYITMDMNEFKKAIDCFIIEDYDKESLEWQEEEYGGVCVEITYYEEGSMHNLGECDEMYIYSFPEAELVTDKELVADIQSGKVKSYSCYEVDGGCYGEGEEFCYISRLTEVADRVSVYRIANLNY